MSELKGKDMKFYTGDGLRVIGCETSFTLNIRQNLFITNTKGSGRGTNREVGSYDWDVSFEGAVFLIDAFADGDKTDPFELAAFILQGLKVGVKIEVDSEGTDAYYYYGRGVIESVSYTGQVEGFATYSGVLRADGALSATRTTTYTGLKELSFSSNSFAATYSSTSLLNKTIAFIIQNGVVRNPSLYSFIPDNGSGFGVIVFSPTLPANQTMRVFYE